ncbi:MAG: hypothetical protein M1819_001695 [Sarea resinae]|nr:MAG: hypothetical protein M1819_001695 [Sarea resinae]
MPPFKDEHILIIAPGSQTTLAQLGLPESFTPARFRFPTRMFPAEKKGEWEPYKIRPKKPAKESTKDPEAKAQEDTQMTDAGSGGETAKPTTGEHNGDSTGNMDGEDGGNLYEEDPDSEEGAVLPLKEGRVVDWTCFFALLTHIYNTLSPPFHTPILVVAQPTWTAQDHEILTQFFFEKFKTPAFCLMDSAVAACYAYGIPTATIIDVGFEKTDVTAVSEFITHDVGRGIAVPGCGGDSMTLKLLELLKAQDFSYDMCEQLKRSPICEVLPQSVPIPEASDPSTAGASNPAAVASTGATGPGPNQRDNAAARGEAPRGPGPDTEVGDEGQEGKYGEEDEGVLDVATIVTSGKTNEFLAQKEKEKAERIAAKKAGDAAAAAAKPVRLPNFKRTHNTFWLEERRRPEDEANGDGHDAKRQKTPQPAENEPTNGQAAAEELNRSADATAAPEANSEAAPKGDETQSTEQEQPEGSKVSRREVKVGTERFLAATGGILESIADVVHRTVLAVEDVRKRSELWDSLIILGNGSRVRGFKDALISTIISKYLISPSSATIFTSELPSNLSTPLATGASTPQPQAAGALHGSAGVNPLLYAATTASNPNLAASTSASHFGQHSHSSHAQTPTSVKIAKIPEYFSEWKDAGYEEASFLGAQVAAKVIFVVDQGLNKGFMSRVEYNDLGPQGIHDSSL